MNNLWQALENVAGRTPELPCLIVPIAEKRSYLPDGLELSYGEVAGKVQQLIDIYSGRGWGLGHRVALLLENRPDFLLHFLALNAIGAWVVPLNPDYRSDDLKFLFEHAKPDLLVTLPERLPYLQTATARHMSKDAVVPATDFASSLSRPGRPAQAGSAKLESEAILLYTSGTTGMPKGCVIGNDYLFFAGQRYIDAGGTMSVRHGAERLFNPLPLFYANSLAISNPAMILSANAMIFPDRFHPASWWEEVVQTQATIIHYLGIIPPLLLARPVESRERQHNLRFGIGAGIDPAQHAEFETRFGFPLIEVWGMSEVGIATADNHEPRAIDRRSIGRPLNGIEIAIVDDDDQPLSAGRPGELVIRRRPEDSSNPRLGLFQSYFKDEEATAAAWRNGWFHTGDIAAQEADGSYSFVDRKKHMIRRSGQNIAAAEVEACLKAHAMIAQVAVVPAPDEMRQEEVLACIVLRPDAEHLDRTAMAESVVRHALRRLAYFKVPGWVLFVPSLPTTATQKLQKAQIFGTDEDPRSRPGIIDLRPLKKKPALDKRGIG